MHQTPWQIKQFLESQTPLEHLADTGASLSREHMLLAIAHDSSYQGQDTGQRFLHAYLNDCSTYRTAQWYESMQKGFFQHHQEWSSLFDAVLNSRRRQGSKKQRANITGDWLALSQLSGQPLSFDLLTADRPQYQGRTKKPIDYVVITVGMPRDNAYKDVFELLYFKHQAEHRGWNALLQRMHLRGMTAKLWDQYIELYPKSADLPLKSMNIRAHDWSSVLKEFLNASHALALNRVVVHMMQNGKADELYNTFPVSPLFHKPDEILYNRDLSEALYETLQTSPSVRLKMSTSHLVHAINNDIDRLEAELDIAVGDSETAHVALELISTSCLKQLNPKARGRLLELLREHPQKYNILLDSLMSRSTTSLTVSEFVTVLQHPYAKALFVINLFDGLATRFATDLANASPELSSALLAANFTHPHAFEAVLMQKMTPELSYEDVDKLFGIAKSLGLEDNLSHKMIQDAFECTPQTSDVSIHDVLNDVVLEEPSI